MKTFESPTRKLVYVKDALGKCDYFKVLLANKFSRKVPWEQKSFYYDGFVEDMHLFGIYEIHEGNGYVSGGSITTITSLEANEDSIKVLFTPVTFTASGNSIGPFRYSVLYGVQKKEPGVLILRSVYCDFGLGPTTINNEEQFTIGDLKFTMEI